MSSRRLARAKKNPRFNLSPDADPNHIKRGSIDHPVFGHVRLWIRAGKIYRLQWSSVEHGQNFHARYWEPKKFGEILKRLGL